MLVFRFLRSLPAALLLLASVRVGAFPADTLSKRTLQDYIDHQRVASIVGIYDNLGPGGSKAGGAAAGVLIASPSHGNPDYFSTWTRDSALTFKGLIERLIDGDDYLRPWIVNYIYTQGILQQLKNPSGGPDSGGLGDPRFNIDRTTWSAPWGRPQRDGPALRATALTIYSNWLIDNGGKDQVLDSIWPILEKDLAYTTRYWNQTGFDLWEETPGSSFFTLSASHRALVEGAALADRLGMTCRGCTDAAPQVLCFMQSFWNGKFIHANLNPYPDHPTTRSGLDSSSILSAIHTFDPKAQCTDATFQPCSPRALANLKALTDSFRSAYGINHNIPRGVGVAIGRYSEDTYYDGNPWYLTTLAAAEQLYDAVYQWNSIKSITVNDLSLPFFQEMLPTLRTGTYDSHSPVFNMILSAVSGYADSFVTVVQAHTPDYRLAEQFDRNNGAPKSAPDLTWSYASFITATDRRAGKVGPSWGSSKNETPASACTGTPLCSLTTFVAQGANTPAGAEVYVLGQLDQLGNWDPDRAMKLSDGPIHLPSDIPFEFKFINKKASDAGWKNWSKGDNYVVTTAENCGSSQITENVTWEYYVYDIDLINAAPRLRPEVAVLISIAAVTAYVVVSLM